MPPIDQRSADGSREHRKPWIDRYWKVISWFLGGITCVAIAAVSTWHMSTLAYGMAEENKSELKIHSTAIEQIPVLQESLNGIEKNFNDFRTEQRSMNVWLRDNIK